MLLTDDYIFVKRDLKKYKITSGPVFKRRMIYIFEADNYVSRQFEINDKLCRGAIAYT